MGGVISLMILLGAGLILTKKDSKCVGKNNSIEETDKITYKKSFGEYSIASGWEENQEHSTSDMFFYVKKGDEVKSQPDNIAVNVGENKYSLEESESFRTAILQQLTQQISEYEGIALTGEGFQTEQGNAVYLFNIAEEDTGLVTRQYYIVGEKKYCLVQESNFADSEECRITARNLVESFKWIE